MLLDAVKRDDDVRDLVSLGLVEVTDLTNEPQEAPLGEEIASVSAELRERWRGVAPSEIPQLAPARELYRSIGIDPTKHRPSSEALLRRVLRGAEFPRVCAPVDLANLWSLASGLSVGLYDAGKLAGSSVTLRLGRAGESYAGIRKPEIRVEGRLVLADDAGPFGNPTSDSLRTAVSAETGHCLFIMFAPTSFDVSRLDRWAGWLRERALAYLGGSARSAVLP